MICKQIQIMRQKRGKKKPPTTTQVHGLTINKQTKQNCETRNKDQTRKASSVNKDLVHQVMSTERYFMLCEGLESDCIGCG